MICFLNSITADSEFVSERLAAWRLDVAALYAVGISGRTFESFPVPRF